VRRNTKEGVAVSYTMDPAAQLARQVLQVLGDGAAQPLAEVQDRAPEDCNYFSELEASLGEWGFAYGVAWALVRNADPLMPSAGVADLARDATRQAWRLYSEESWRSMLREDRDRRGPVEGGPSAATLSDFMGKVGKTRPTRAGRGPQPVEPEAASG
jgi:hypothetical protein